MQSKHSVPHFSPEELHGLRSVFNQIDTDKNGLLDHSEFYQFLLQAGIDTRFVKAAFYVFDTNHDDGLSFEEFLSYFDACRQTETNPHYLFKLVFDSVDSDHNGLLNFEELIEFARLCGQDATPEKIREEINRIDLNRNGFVDFNELCMAFNL